MLWWSSMVCFVFESSNWAICIASSRTRCWPRLFSSIFPIPKFGDSSRSIAMDYRWTIYAELSSHIHVISLANSQMCHRDILWWSLKTRGGKLSPRCLCIYFSPLDTNQLEDLDRFSGFAEPSMKSIKSDLTDLERSLDGLRVCRQFPPKIQPEHQLAGCLSLSPPAFNETATPFKGGHLVVATMLCPERWSAAAKLNDGCLHPWLLYLWTITTFDVW